MNYTTLPPEIKQSIRPSLLSWLSDERLALFAPVVLYWAFSMFFFLIDHFGLFDKYRLHTPEEVSSRNRCTAGQVIRAVVAQHTIQTVVGLFMLRFDPPQYTGHEAFEVWKLSQWLPSPMAAKVVYYAVIPSAKIFAAFFIEDTWQYTLHRMMHMNKWLYRNMHSVHHRLYVPYAFGALYNSLLEGFLLDTLGAAVAYMLTGLTAREQIIFYTLSTLKTVDDHCGYELPFDLFQLIFPNNAAYHDIHHQSFGIKSNFSQPFFIHWDQIFKTKYKDTEEYTRKQRQIRLERHSKRKVQ